MTVVTIRAKLLDAAISLFGIWGYKGVTTRAIAREAGCMEAGLYRHFGNKKKLYSEAIANVAEDSAAKMRDFVVDHFGKRMARETLIKAAIQCWYTSMSQSGAKLLLYVNLNDENHRQLAEGVFRKIVEVILDALGEERADKKRAKARAEALLMQLLVARCKYPGDSGLKKVDVDEWLRIEEQVRHHDRRSRPAGLRVS
jgi:AcrR family transcriptional regulator